MSRELTYLAHYGVKGMKWGVRKKTNNDEQQHISKHKQKIIDKYKRQGYDEHTAKLKADARIKTEILIGIAGAITVGVIATKASTKIGNEYVDKTFKKGKIIQNIGSYKNTTFKDDPFYAATNISDKHFYGKRFPLEKKHFSKSDANYEGIYKNRIKTNEIIKRASNKNARKIFYDKMDNDENFREKVLNVLQFTPYTSGMDSYKPKSSRSTEFYDSFNKALAHPYVQKKGVNKLFYDELKSKGYNAIVDRNDTTNTFYKKFVKEPTIFFGDKWDKISSKKINDKTIYMNAKVVTGEEYAKQALSIATPLASASTAIVYSMNNRLVSNYIKEHPKTNLTRKEILDDIKKKKGGE